MYENDQRKKIDTLGDFYNKTPTHMAATHAISKSKRNFQNRIPRELDKNLYIPRISMIHWISSNLLKLKNRQQKKVISIPNPGIQPSHVRCRVFCVKLGHEVVCKLVYMPVHLYLSFFLFKTELKVLLTLYGNVFKWCIRSLRLFSDKPGEINTRIIGNGTEL